MMSPQVQLIYDELASAKNAQSFIYHDREDRRHKVTLEKAASELQKQVTALDISPLDLSNMKDKVKARKLLRMLAATAIDLSKRL